MRSNCCHEGDLVINADVSSGNNVRLSAGDDGADIVLNGAVVGAGTVDVLAGTPGTRGDLVAGNGNRLGGATVAIDARQVGPRTRGSIPVPVHSTCSRRVVAFS